MSQDGRNWARLEAEHHTAAVLDAGGAGDWDEAFIGSPQAGSRPPNQCHARGLIIALLINVPMCILPCWKGNCVGRAGKRLLQDVSCIALDRGTERCV